MDEKHRQYCIKLGNPYMKEEIYKQQYQMDKMDSTWIDENNKQDDLWFKKQNNNW